MSAVDVLQPEARVPRPAAGGRGAEPAPDRKSRTEAAVTIARLHAAAVDGEARFPSEAIAAAGGERLMGIMVPRDFGGEGASVSDAVDICYRLGQACASTAMTYAMHQTKVACIVRHGRNDGW